MTKEEIIEELKAESIRLQAGSLAELLWEAATLIEQQALLIEERGRQLAYANSQCGFAEKERDDAKQQIEQQARIIELNSDAKEKLRIAIMERNSARAGYKDIKEDYEQQARLQQQLTTLKAERDDLVIQKAEWLLSLGNKDMQIADLKAEHERLRKDLGSPNEQFKKAIDAAMQPTSDPTEGYQLGRMDGNCER